ncbi:MAG: c-type cytochrome [Rhodospirillaceae bacterium]
MRMFSMFGLVAAGLLISGSAFAAGDAAKGEASYNKFCKACHSTDAGKNLVGPSLHGVVGRTAGSATFAFSAGVKALGYAWTEDKLDAWLTSPKAVVPATKMTFAGVANADDRANIIAFLATKK